MLEPTVVPAKAAPWLESKNTIWPVSPGSVAQLSNWLTPPLLPGDVNTTAQSGPVLEECQLAPPSVVRYQAVCVCATARARGDGVVWLVGLGTVSISQPCCASRKERAGAEAAPALMSELRQVRPPSLVRNTVKWSVHAAS